MEWNETFPTLVGLLANCSQDPTIVNVQKNCTEPSLRYNLSSMKFSTSKPGFVNNSNGAFNFSSNNTEKDPLKDLDVPFAIIVGIILGVIILLVILGNVLVLLAVFVNSHLRTTTNLFIISLASADLLLATTVLPFSASLEVIHVWVFGETFCDIWACIDVLCCTASILSLCAISIDRYIGVTKPLRHSAIMTQRRTIWFIVCIWFLSAAISIGPLIGWKETPVEPDPYSCSVNKQVGYVLFSVAGSFYIPAFIIIFVYLRIYREAARQSKSIARGFITTDKQERAPLTMRVHSGRLKKFTLKGNKKSGAHKNGNNKNEVKKKAVKKPNSKTPLSSRIAKFNREKKAAKTLGIVVGVFLICWFPFFFLLPLETLCPQCVIPELLFKIIFWLGYCNSLMNPVIYACNSRDFKRAFRQILSCNLSRRRRNRSEFYGGSSFRRSVSALSTRSQNENEKVIQLTNIAHKSSDASITSPSPMLRQTSFTDDNCNKNFHYNGHSSKQSLCSSRAIESPNTQCFVRDQKSSPTNGTVTSQSEHTKVHGSDLSSSWDNVDIDLTKNANSVPKTQLSDR